MQIIENARKFYFDNEYAIWTGACVVAVAGYCLCLGYLFGAGKFYSKGVNDGVKTAEALVAAMEPEAYARICKTAETAVKILK